MKITFSNGVSINIIVCPSKAEGNPGMCLLLCKSDSIGDPAKHQAPFRFLHVRRTTYYSRLEYELAREEVRSNIASLATRVRRTQN